MTVPQLISYHHSGYRYNVLMLLNNQHSVYIIVSHQGRRQEFATGGQDRGSGGRKSPSGVQGQSEGVGAKSQKPETNANFQLRRGGHAPMSPPWLHHCQSASPSHSSATYRCGDYLRVLVLSQQWACAHYYSRISSIIYRYLPSFYTGTNLYCLVTEAHVCVCVWITCTRSLPDSGVARIWTRTCRLQIRRPNQYAYITHLYSQKYGSRKQN